MSNFYDQASLVLVPSGYKDQKLYAQKPQTSAGQFLFNRGSDLEVTRVNSQGKVEKAILNGLLQSNTFSTTWGNSNTTETGGQADKDGGTTAWKLEKSAASGYIIQSLSITGVHTFSVYAKAGTLDWIRLNINLTTGTDPIVYFNLSSGTIGSTPVGQIDAKIQSVGGGWYRCSVTANGTIQDVRFFPADGDNDVSGTSGNIYIQDAQLNYGLVAQDYVETTTAAVISGLKLDTPRLNYDPANPTCPSLLLEGSRQNLFTHSEYLNGYNVGGAILPTLTSNYATSPEGVSNAYRVQFANIPTDSLIFQLVSHTSGIAMTISGYVKSNTGSNQSFKLYGDYGTLDARSSVLTATSEWQRFTFTFTPTATGSRGAGILSINNTASDLLVYGMQIEVGSYPTSYIPTYGSSATRNAETSIQALAAGIFTSTEGAWFFQVKDMKFDITGTGVGSMDLSVSGNLNTSFEVVQDGNDMFKITLDGSTAVQDLDGEKKVAITWGSFGLKIYVDGAQAYTTANTTYSRQYNYFSLSRPTREWSGLMKQLIFFPSALSDTELATLTA